MGCREMPKNLNFPNKLIDKVIENLQFKKRKPTIVESERLGESQN